jgi:hypothetical protein
MNTECPLTVRRIEAIRLALSSHALTLHELAARVHVCLEQARRYVRYMHRAHLIYIATWRSVQTTRLTRLPAYRAGAGKDIPKPSRLTPAQRTAAYRERVRSDPERYDLYKAKGRAQKRKPARDELVAALFGAPSTLGDHHA